MLVFWLDWNAVKDVVGSCPLAAGGENQNKQDPSHLRSCSVTVDKTATRAPKPEEKKRETRLVVAIGDWYFKTYFGGKISQLSCTQVICHRLCCDPTRASSGPAQL